MVLVLQVPLAHMEWKSCERKGEKGMVPTLRHLRNIRHPYLKVEHLPVIALSIYRFSRSRCLSSSCFAVVVSALLNFAVLRQLTLRNTIIKRSSRKIVGVRLARRLQVSERKTEPESAREPKFHYRPCATFCRTIRLLFPSLI